MKRYLIEEAKCGSTGWGPCIGHTVSSVRFNNGTKSQWLSLEDVDGYFYFYLTEDDIFDHLIEEDYVDEDPEKYINGYGIGEFDGLQLEGEDGDETIESLSEQSTHPATQLFKLAITLACCSTEDEESIISMAKGKYADELIIPEIDNEYDEDDDENEEE